MFLSSRTYEIIYPAILADFNMSKMAQYQIFFAILVWHGSYALSLSPRNLSSSPKIWLHSLEEADSYEDIPVDVQFITKTIFQNDFVSKNGTDYLVYRTTNEVNFGCKASYPVSWDFQHLEQIDSLPVNTFSVSTYRKSELKNDQREPNNEYFYSFLRLQLGYLDFFSVTLTCANALEINGGSVKFQSRSSASIHVFHEGENAIEKKGSTLTAYFDEPSDKVSDIRKNTVLPCRPATPSIKMILEKYIETVNSHDGNVTGEWTRIDPTSGFVNFDAKVGFTIINRRKTNGGGKNILGMYRCIAVDQYTDENDPIDNDSQVVYINVSEAPAGYKQAKPSKFETTLELEGNASVFYNQKWFGHKRAISTSSPVLDGSIIACSGKENNRPVCTTHICEDPLQCELLKHSIPKVTSQEGLNDGVESGVDELPKDCDYTLFWYTDAVFLCTGNNLRFLEYFEQFFSKDLQNVTKRSKHRTGQTMSSISDFETERDAQGNSDITRKIFLAILYPLSHEHFRKSKILSNQRRYLDGGTKFFLTNKQDYSFEFEQENIHRWHDKLEEYSRDYYFETEPLSGICLGWKMRYADGPHLSINWRNGSRTVLQLVVAEGEMDSKTVYFTGIDGMFANLPDMVYRISTAVLAHKDMVAMECWMPQWNSDRWDKLVRNVTIFESFPPKFIDKKEKEQMIYVYLGDDGGHTLEWKIFDGIPQSTLNVTRDGNLIIYHDPQNRHSLQHQNNTVFSVSVVEDQGSSNMTDERNRSSVTNIKITFGKVTHEMQGVYQCTAENVRGRVIHVFRVIVSGRRSFLLPISISVVIILFLIMIVTGVMYKYKNRKLHLLRIAR